MQLGRLLSFITSVCLGGPVAWSCGDAVTPPKTIPQGGPAVASGGSPAVEQTVSPSGAGGAIVAGPDAASGGQAASPELDAGLPKAPAGIVVDGRRLLKDGQPLLLSGLCWNPVGVGVRHPEGLGFAGFADLDIPLFVELGVNVVRTYEPLLDRGVLDRLAAAGIYVINSVYPFGGSEVGVVTERVRAVKDHPAVLMWSVGNEWNYNGLYIGLSHEESLARLNEAARLIKAEDPLHPVSTIYGELPSTATLEAMPDIDVWGINSYRGLSFGDLFDSWAASSGKPMFIAEYGADAYNAGIPAYDPESQALAVAALSREILEQASALGSDGVALGGTLFEWADEWWKDETGSLDAQDVGGIAPGAGPYPDQVFNEEWWGIVDVQRTPRPAYEALRPCSRRLKTRSSMPGGSAHDDGRARWDDELVEGGGEVAGLNRCHHRNGRVWIGDFERLVPEIHGRVRLNATVR